jgi:hypothetical protein
MIIGSTTIAYPTSFAIEPIEIARRGQTASGKATKEVIATKKKFTLQWNILRGAEYQAIITALAAGDFLSFTYPDNNTTDTVTVYADSGLKARLANQHITSWVYKDVDLTLIEQ